jgi:hypothetical protein
MDTENVSSEVVETPSDSIESNQGSPVAPEGQSLEAPPLETPAYNPNFKFKVLDKELEIDPLYRDLIKDAETEKKIREMHEKAFGLDSVKADRQSLKQKIETHYAPLEKTHHQTMKTLEVFDKMIEKQDFDNFFSTLQISEQDVLKWAVKKAQLMELTPEQQAEYNRSVQERNRLYQLESQNQEFQDQSFDQQVQDRTSQLEQELSKPEVLNVVSSFDARVGTQGAFRAEVIKRGQLHAFQGNDISVEQAVKEVIDLMGGIPQVNTPQGQSTAPANNNVNGTSGQAPQAQVQAPKPKVIPNVTGQGTSPVKKVVRSLDDLRALSRAQTN